MVAPGIGLGIVAPAPLLGNDVHQDWPLQVARVREDVRQEADVVPVNRADIVEAEGLEEGAMLR